MKHSTALIHKKSYIASFACSIILYATGLLNYCRAQLIELQPVVTTATRSLEPESNIATKVTTIDRYTIEHSPAVTIDGILSNSPDFSLFRRDSSIGTNPTAQGVSLRGMGPSGASRSLILLDGIPLNDPFGGWITWSAVPRISLTSVEIISAGGSSAWGNTALSGVVQLLSDDPTLTHNSLDLDFGSFKTQTAEFELSTKANKSSIEVLGNSFATHGYKIISPSQVGPIDQPASNQHSWIETRFVTSLSPGLKALVTAQTFQEKRNNGTVYQKNTTHKTTISGQLTGTVSSQQSWDFTTYVQNSNFTSTYSSVNALRNSETPTSNQYDVPSSAAGGAFIIHWITSSAYNTTLGIDFRTVHGETREAYLYSNGSFLNNRLAGGLQNFSGIFIQHQHTLIDLVHASLGLRFDHWSKMNGHLQEYVMSNAASVTNNLYSDQHGNELSPSLGLTMQLRKSLRVRFNIEHSFRVPTLNELYRPFTQGYNVTLANPYLKTEQALNTDLGFDYTKANTTLSLSGFLSTISNSVNAVTIFKGPGVYPGVGSISAAGSILERNNLNSIHAEGIDGSYKYKLSNTINFKIEGLFITTRIDKANIAPTLIGKSLVQVPKTNLTAHIDWSAPLNFTLNLDMHWLNKQFVDDQNLLSLNSVTRADVSINYKLWHKTSVYFKATNLTNSTIQTGLSSSGLTNVGSPRALYAGLHIEL